MNTLRAWAVATLFVLAAYNVLRLKAARCSGLQCDWLIPVSLLLPLLILAMVGLTGLLAVLAAGRRAPAVHGPLQKRQQPVWFWLLRTSLALGVLGPPACLAIFRDNPDVFVATASVLAALVPLTALVYSFASSH